MKIIELQVDDHIFEQAQRAAAAREYSSVQAMIVEILELLTKTSPVSDPLLGMFAQEPDLLDQMIEATMQTRETASLRHIDG